MMFINLLDISYAEKVGMSPLIIYDGNNQQILIDKRPEDEIFRKRKSIEKALN